MTETLPYLLLLHAHSSPKLRVYLPLNHICGFGAMVATSKGLGSPMKHGSYLRTIDGTRWEVTESVDEIMKQVSGFACGVPPQEEDEEMEDEP
jgi:hypothetical protein